MEQLARGALEGIDRKVASKNNRNRIKNGTINIFRGGKNYFVQVVTLSLTYRQLAIDIFYHHHCAVDHDAEVNCPYGKQIRRNVVGMQHDKSEQQRKWNRDRNDN